VVRKLADQVGVIVLPRRWVVERFFAWIQTVHDRLKQIETGSEVASRQLKTPAVPIRKSVTPDYLVCLDDRLRFKSLRRHLAALGVTPE
jgi:predicted transcriptional regulator